MLVLGQLARNWWVFVLQGVIAILFGVLAFARPGITLEVLVLLFAIWALLDGVLALISSVGAAEAHEPWWPFVFEGLLGIAAGLLTLRWARDHCADPSLDHRFLVHLEGHPRDRRRNPAEA